MELHGGRHHAQLLHGLVVASARPAEVIPPVHVSLFYRVKVDRLFFGGQLLNHVEFSVESPLLQGWLLGAIRSALVLISLIVS